MASAVTETEVYEASVIGPDDGDARNAASVRVGLEDLANRTKFLKARTNLLATVTTYEGDPGWSGGAVPALTSAGSTSGTSFTNFAGRSVTISNIKTGDIVWVHCTVVAKVSAAGDVGHLRLGNSTVSLAMEGAYAIIKEDAVEQNIALVGKWVADADYGSREFFLMGAVTGADTLTIYNPMCIHGYVGGRA